MCGLIRSRRLADEETGYDFSGNGIIPAFLFVVPFVPY